jgi:hypothetical protein
VTQFSTEEEALAEVLPDLRAGDRVVIHEGDCAIHDGHLCDCDVLVVDGPSGKA